jgi:NAD(P)-dependent dehydrogenase (short-subunit alcohol dehydrogenase family)
MANTILVTGAAGRLGAVGRTVTGLLLKQGKAVRAMVRNEDERARALRDMGAEVVVGDLLDLDSMHKAIAVDRLLQRSQEGALEMSKYRLTLMGAADHRCSRYHGENNFMKNARIAWLRLVVLIILSICAGANCAYSQSTNSSNTPG